MATINNGAPLGDPRKRWLSSGSQNQQQSFYNKVYQPQGQQKPQGAFNPYAGTPLEANDGMLYKPKGQPDAWEPTGQVNYDPNDPMGGWDYRNPPVNNQGVPMDRDGNPLPAGATGWNPHGEPDFTPLGRTDLAASFEGWFKGIQYRLHQGTDPTQEKNPFVSAAETAAGYLEKGDFKQGLPAAWNFLMQVGPGLRELGGNEEGAPTLATYAGRTIAEMGRGIGSAYGLFAKTAESLIGTGQLTMQDAQEGSPLPDINYPDWMPGWATAITDTVGPLAAYNSLRVLTAPKKSWDEARDNLDENWQASRIAYSVLNDVTLKDEYVRRYKAGENPAYLATELQKPIDEMIGQLILDPLNAAGFFTRAGVTARRLGKVEDIFINPSAKVDEAFKALRANTVAEGANALENLAQAVKDQVGKVSANLDELAQNRGLLQLTTEGKRQDIASRSSQMIRWLFANTRKADKSVDYDKAMEIMRALVLKTDDNLSAVAEGVDILTHAPVPKPLFSRAADELGVILRNHLIDATQPAGQTPLPGMRGNLDFSAFLRGFEEAKAGGLDGVVQWATSKLDESAKAYFPTVLEQADAIDRLADYRKTGAVVLKPGETLADLERYANLGVITPAQRFVARFDKMTKGAIYTPINRFFANVYMGMSPGFAFRNLMNNALTISVDAGAGSIFVSKEKAVNGVRELLGGVTNAKMGGFGGIGATIEGAGEAEQGYKWWQFGLKKSAEFEELGAAQISYKAVKDVMRQMLRPGKALPDIAPLVDAGMDTQTANLLTRLVLEYDGNADKALARFRELAAPGNIEITKTALWLGEEDIRIAQSFNVWEQMKVIYQGDGTLAEKQAKITALAVDTEKFADAAKFEQTGATDMLASLEGNNILLNASEATAQGLMSDAESAIANHRVWANAYTRRAYENLVTTIRREAVSLAPEFAKQVDETGMAMLNQMDSLWSGTNNTHELFTKQVWARTQELKSGKGTATIPQLWDEFKMTGEPFAGMGKDEFLDALWNHWRTETRTRWATTREAYAAFGETYWQNVRKTSGYEPSKALLDQAREALAQARAFDDAVVETTSKGPLVFQTKDKILSALGRGDAKTAIAILADHYGISSATAKGTFYDKQILNTFRAYSGRNKAFSLTDALKPLAELPEEFARALADEARIMLDELKAASGPVVIEATGTGSIKASDNPGWYVDLFEGGYKNKTTLTNALQRIVDGKDGGDFSYLRAVKEAVFDRLQQQSGLYPELERILSGKGKDFSNLTLEDVWRAFEAQRTAKGKGTLIENLDAYLSGYISRQKIEQFPSALSSTSRITPPPQIGLLDTVKGIVGTDNNYNLWSNVRDKSDYAEFLDNLALPIRQFETASTDILSKITRQDVDDILSGSKVYANKSDRSRVVDSVMDWIANKINPPVAPRVTPLDTFPTSPIPGQLSLSSAPLPGFDYRTPADEIAKATGLPEDVIRNWQAQARYEEKKRKIAEEVTDKTRLYTLTSQAEREIKGAAMRFSASLKENNLTREEVYAILGPNRATARGASASVISGVGDAIPLSAPALANTLPPTQGTMPGFTTPGGLTVGPDGNPIPLRTPYMDGSMPTGPRATAENLAGLKDWLNRVNQKLSDSWGTLTPADFSPKVEQALGGWKAQATERIGEARLLASGYADLMRDFALHDYSHKKNLDLVAAYLFPYEFWYTRTYKNWLTRLVSNPETIAAYAKYRTALEHLHAGSPEWWKYNINSNELLGRNDDNPLFFNLEATLNPLNGLTGTDFNDPAKRVDWLTRSLDDVGKFGPSTWTPLNFALALSLYAKGEQDAAARWAGRLIPQTATLRSIGAIFNQNLEVDPFTHFFAGGQDPYEQRRVAMALAALAQGVTINGEYVQITDEQAIDAASPEIRAANPEAQAIWEQATQYALDKRTPGQLASFFLGVGFKGRNLSDIQIDKMYSEYYTLWNRSSDLNADEFRDLMDQLHTRYPWMDSILIAKKSGPEVDRALAYNVLGRIPPGQASDITKLIGIDPGIIEQFYANKGDLSFMTKPDRDRFMAGIVDLSALLALPENATREEWGMVRSDYKAMQAEGARLFGEDIWERVDRYFAINQANPDAAKLLMGNDPLLEKVLSWKEEQVMGNELLFAYYGGLDFLEKYYKGQKYATLDAQFPDIQSAWDGYNALKDLGDTKGARAYWNEHPELKAYLEASDTWNLSIEEKLDALAGKLREPLPGELRQEFAQPQGSMQEQAAPAFGYNPPVPTWQDYQALISQDQSNLLEDYFAGGTLSPAMKKSLTRLAEQLGIPYETLLFQMESSYFGEQVPAAP